MHQISIRKEKIMEIKLALKQHRWHTARLVELIEREYWAVAHGWTGMCLIFRKTKKVLGHSPFRVLVYNAQDLGHCLLVSSGNLSLFRIIILQPWLILCFFVKFLHECAGDLMELITKIFNCRRCSAYYYTATGVTMPWRYVHPRFIHCDI
jgi:hypothetical protein